MTPIAVLVGPMTQAVSGREVRSRADALAASLALRLDTQARLLCAGSMSDETARSYLALGATEVCVLELASHLDFTAALSAQLQHTPWVFAGTRQGTEVGEGILPYALAHALGRPIVTDVLDIEPDGDAWIVTQALPRGARRRLRVKPPAVLVVSATVPLTLRHALASAQSGRIERLPPMTAPSAAHQDSGLAPRQKRRQALQARTAQSGHARMLGAIDSPSAGGAVINSGDASSKAKALLSYLRTHSLVHF